MTRSSDALWRPLAFFSLMIGLGLRLDTGWQRLAALLIVAGAVTGGVGLWQLARRSGATAFVPTGGKG